MISGQTLQSTARIDSVPHLDTDMPSNPLHLTTSGLKVYDQLFCKDGHDQATLKQMAKAAATRFLTHYDREPNRSIAVRTAFLYQIHAYFKG